MKDQKLQLVTRELVATLINDITIASNEQTTGIQQINQGITQVSQVVQTNSATSEESAAASEELSSQAEVLNTMVSKFNLQQSSESQYLQKYINPDVMHMLDNRTQKKQSVTGKKTNVKNIKLSDQEFGKY
jgi:methyl-accepting chemotaxis protein